MNIYKKKKIRNWLDSRLVSFESKTLGYPEKESEKLPKSNDFETADFPQPGRDERSYTS
jgi:hypothetical protein